jgi:hypothetical protein
MREQATDGDGRDGTAIGVSPVWSSFRQTCSLNFVIEIFLFTTLYRRSEFTTADPVINFLNRFMPRLKEHQYDFG